jgi:acetolactate synthase regulatory subunit
MTLHITLLDREGALERLISTCRRRGYGLASLFAAGAEDGAQRVDLSLVPGRATPELLLATLYRIQDIAHIEVIEARRQVA